MKQDIKKYCIENKIEKYYAKIMYRINKKKLSFEEAIKNLDFDERKLHLGSVQQRKYFVVHNDKQVPIAEALKDILKQYDLSYPLINCESLFYFRMNKKGESSQEAFEHIKKLYNKKFCRC